MERPFEWTPEKMSRPSSPLTSHPEQPVFDIVKAKSKVQAAGTTYAALARALGFERQAVGHWFRGRGEPSVQQMKVMAAALGCHWLELVTEETMVVYQAEERARLERIRSLTGGDLAELDAFLAFKAAKAAGGD